MKQTYRDKDILGQVVEGLIPRRLINARQTFNGSTNTPRPRRIHLSQELDSEEYDLSLSAPIYCLARQNLLTEILFGNFLINRSSNSKSNHCNLTLAQFGRQRRTRDSPKIPSSETQKVSSSFSIGIYSMLLLIACLFVVTRTLVQLNTCIEALLIELLYCSL